MNKDNNLLAESYKASKQPTPTIAAKLFYTKGGYHEDPNVSFIGTEEELQQKLSDGFRLVSAWRLGSSIQYKAGFSDSE